MALVLLSLGCDPAGSHDHQDADVTPDSGSPPQTCATSIATVSHPPLPQPLAWSAEDAVAEVTLISLEDFRLTLAFRIEGEEREVQLRSADRLPPIEVGDTLRVTAEVHTPGVARVVLEDDEGLVAAYLRHEGIASVRQHVEAFGESVGLELTAEPQCRQLGGGQCGRAAIGYSVRSGSVAVSAGEQGVVDGKTLRVVSASDDVDLWPEDVVCAIGPAASIAFDLVRN